MMAEMFYSAFILIFALYGAVCLSRRLYLHFLFPKGKAPAYLLVPLRGEACEQPLRAAIALAKDGACGRLRGVVAVDLGLDAAGRKIVETMQSENEPVTLLSSEGISGDLQTKLQEVLE
jgi:hypothetical protein